MTMEKQPFEDVSPNKNWCFSIVMLVLEGVSILFWNFRGIKQAEFPSFRLNFPFRFWLEKNFSLDFWRDIFCAPGFFRFFLYIDEFFFDSKLLNATLKT